MAKLLDKLPSSRRYGEKISPDEIQWLWKVEKLSPFLESILKYTDESNILDDSQIDKFLECCQNGNELKGEELDRALQEYGVDVQNCQFSNLSDFDLELCDLELNELKIQNNIASLVETALSDESQKTLIDEQKAETDLKYAQAACQREGQNLMKINVSLKSTLSTFVGTISKLLSLLADSEDPDIHNCCISNMPLENILHSCQKFNEYVALCLKRKFEQNSISDKKNIAELVSFLDEEPSMRSLSSSSSSTRNSLPYNMWKTDVSRIAMLGTLNEHSAAVRHLQTIKGNSSFEKLNSLSLKIEVSKLQDDISRLSEDISLLLRHDIGNMIEDAVLCDIMHVVRNITKSRIDRRQLRLRELCSIASVTHKFLYLTDLLWMLFSRESQQFRMSLDLLKKISDYFIEDLTRHEATMWGLNNIMKDFNLSNDSLRSGQALLLGTLQRLSDINVSDSESGYNETMSESQSREMDCAQLLDVLESLKKQHPDRELLIYQLLSELTNGPTKKPSLVRKDLSLALQEVDTYLQKCHAEVDELSSLFSTKQLAFKKSPAARNRRLLWAWFLVAPGELEEALNLAKEESRKKNHR